MIFVQPWVSLSVALRLRKIGVSLLWASLLADLGPDVLLNVLPLLTSPSFLLAVSCAAGFGPLSIPLIWTMGAAQRRLRMLCAVRSLVEPTSTLSATLHPRSPCLGWVPGAGAWLTAHLSCIDSHASSPLFREALQRRPRIPLWDRDTACSKCGEVLDRWGDPALACCCGVIGFCARTRVVCSAVAELTTVSPELEKPGLLLSPRPPDPGGPHLDADPSSASSASPAAGRRPAVVWVPRGVRLR